MAFIYLVMIMCFMTTAASEAETSSDNLDLLAVMKDVSSALENIGSIVKDSAQLQRESLKNQKEIQDHLTAVVNLPHLVNSLESRLLNTKNENEQNLIKVHDLENELNRALETIEKLKRKEEICEEQDESTETKLEESCSLAGEENIKKQVQEYNRTKDWSSLYRVLEKELCRDSAAYKELQSLGDSAKYPMYYITQSGMTGMMEVLVTCGGAINVADMDGGTMLHGAVSNNNFALVQWLLNRGANTECSEGSGRTPLINAASYGHLEAVRYLVQAGANTTARMSNGLTPLQWATYNRHTAVVEYLSQLPQ